jgi:pimeloyl-ACP methyl ester carboxylesterase
MKLIAFFVLAICSISTLGNAQQKNEGFFISFDSTRIYYEVKGNGSPVLLVHGFMNSGEDWKKISLYNELAENGFAVITVDLRGNGKSGKPHDPLAYENDAEAKDLIGLMKSLGYKKYAVVGYSRGAIISSRLLVLDKHVRAAVLGGMGADFTNPQWPRRIAFYNAMMYDSIPGFEGARKRIADNHLDQLALAYQQNGQPSTSKDELGKIRQNVLVVCGDKDQDNGNGEDLARLIPKAKFITVPGNHGSAWHSPEFTSVVFSFLKSNK